MKELPGYLVPRLVRETPGELSKTLLGPFGAT
jgi:L-lysine 2,3-aminomutase